MAYMFVYICICVYAYMCVCVYIYIYIIHTVECYLARVILRKKFYHLQQYGWT